MQVYNITIILCLIGYSQVGMAQAETAANNLDIGYYGHYLIQPGLRIGKTFPLRYWERTSTVPTSRYQRSSYLSLHPSVGYFQQYRTHRTLLLALEVAYTVQKRKKRGYAFHSIGLGIGHQFISQLEGYAISLSDGRITDKKWENSRSWFPHLQYTQGFPLQARTSVYYRLTVGQVFENTDRNAISLFTEVGMRLYFTTKK